MFFDLIGAKSSKVENVIEYGAVKKFSDALNLPIHSLESVKEDSYSVIVPATFPATFDGGKIPNLNLPHEGLIHGEQNYYYNRPLSIGEKIYCWIEINDYKEKKGKLGDTGFLTQTMYGEDEDGQLIFSEERIVIISQKVREGIK